MRLRQHGTFQCSVLGFCAWRKNRAQKKVDLVIALYERDNKIKNKGRYSSIKYLEKIRFCVSTGHVSGYVQKTRKVKNMA